MIQQGAIPSVIDPILGQSFIFGVEKDDSSSNQGEIEAMYDESQPSKNISKSNSPKKKHSKRSQDVQKSSIYPTFQSIQAKRRLKRLLEDILPQTRYRSQLVRYRTMRNSRRG